MPSVVLGMTCTVRRVQLDGTIQGQVEGIFGSQEQQFFENIEEEIPFDGTWKPDPEQLLIVETPPAARVFLEALEENPVAIPTIDTEKFGTQRIRGLFIGKVVNGRTSALVQRFSPNQILSRRWLFGLSGNSFRRLTEPVFSLDSSLACIIDGSGLRFKSFEKLRAMIDTTEIYRSATDNEVRAFANCTDLAGDDQGLDKFVGSADQTTRKLIRAVTQSGVLTTFSADQIQQAAASTKLDIPVQNGKLKLPTNRREMKDVLQFLNDGRWTGLLSGDTFVTNSRRRV